MSSMDTYLILHTYIFKLLSNQTILIIINALYLTITIQFKFLN